MKEIFLQQIMDMWEFEYLTPGIDPTTYTIDAPDINRPALQLTGFFDHFQPNSIQIIGHIEGHYLSQFDQDEQDRRIEAIFTADPEGIPAMIFCRGYRPSERVCATAEKLNIPILVTERKTGDFIGEITVWQKTVLAPMVRIHGVLLSIYGTGVVITGRSGIGKSETALELVKRGHRLVADDVVDIYKFSDSYLSGSAPDMLKNLLELRGVGVINVERLFGTVSVADFSYIDLIINFEEWDENKDYSRMDSDEAYKEILGNKVEYYEMPVRPGRNLAIIVETLAVTYQQRKHGYDAARELLRRTNGI